MESLNHLQTNYKDKLRLVGIVSRDTEKTLSKVIKDNNIIWENYFAKDIITQKNTSFEYGVTGYPHKVLISKEGEVVFTYSGSHPDFLKR